MGGELADLTEHLQRYRATTLQVLDLVEAEDLDWRPSRSQYSLGQQLVHIAQTEDHFSRGLFDRDWSSARLRFPNPLPAPEALRAFFASVRQYTLSKLEALEPDELGAVVEVPNGPPGHSMRSWLWFILEHELHHRGQIWAYLRAMGLAPPFYAMPLAPGERPDIEMREELGGF